MAFSRAAPVTSRRLGASRKMLPNLFEGYVIRYCYSQDHADTYHMNNKSGVQNCLTHHFNCFTTIDFGFLTSVSLYPII